MSNVDQVDFATAPRSPYRVHIASVNGIVSAHGIEPLVDYHVDVLVPDHIDNVEAEVLLLAMRELAKKGIEDCWDPDLWVIRSYDRRS